MLMSLLNRAHGASLTEKAPTVDSQTCLVCITNVPLWHRAVTVGEACGGIWEISASSAQLYSGPKAAVYTVYTACLKRVLMATVYFASLGN